MENHTVNPLGGDHSHTIIFLHGRDSIASEFANEFFESQASDDRTLPEIYPTIKWIFPAAQIRSSARFETEMSQWFDMWSIESPSTKKELQIDGLRESIGEILDIIRSETLLVPAARIILGGISQGCATAIHALLCGEIRLGGFIGLNGWLPFQDDIATITTEFTRDDALPHIRALFNRTGHEPNVHRDLSDLSRESALETPIFLSHSQDDPLALPSNGAELSRTLQDLGLAVTWKTYEDGGHWINEPRGVDDIVAFLHEKVGGGL
jgi:lysophospholipase-2